MKIAHKTILCKNTFLNIEMKFLSNFISIVAQGVILIRSKHVVLAFCFSAVTTWSHLNLYYLCCTVKKNEALQLG